MPNHASDTAVARRRPSVVRPDGTVPPGWKPQTATVTVVCDTVGCENEGLEFALDISTNADGIDRINCGACLTWMDNVTDTPGREIGRYRNGTKEA